MKRKMNVLCLVLVSSVALLGSLKASPIGVYVSDSFDGNALDPLVWVSSGSVSVGPPATVIGSVIVNAAGGQFSYMNSIPSVKPDAGQTVFLLGGGLSSVPFSDGLGFGLYNLDNNNFIMINELSNGSLQLDVRVGGGTAQSSSLSTVGGFQGDFSLAWSPTQIVITQDSNVVFDSAVNGPVGGGSWNFPTVALSATAFSYVNSNTITLQSVELQVVPEPSTVAMVGFAGLGLVIFLRRKRSAV